MNSTVWILFNGLILALLALDLFWFNRKAHEIRIRESLSWSAFWIGLAVLFNVFIYYWLGAKSALNIIAPKMPQKSTLC